MADRIVTTDHSGPASKRVELAASAAWDITSICDELREHVAKLTRQKPPQPHHSAVIMKLLIQRVRTLAETAALCLEEDEENQPFADLERTVAHG